MKKPDNNNRNIKNENNEVIGQLIGMGKQSARKSYYPMLQEKINELNKEKQKYKYLLDSITDAIFIASLDGIIIDANLEACKRYGYSLSELTGKPISEIEFVFNQQMVRDKCQYVLENKQSIFETIQVDRAGNNINTEVTANLITYNNEPALICVNRDITFIKLTEEELKTSQNQLQSIFKAAPCGIGVVVSRHFTYLNKCLCDMLGYNENELIGHSTREIYANDQEYQKVGYIYDDIAEKGLGSIETQAICKDGSTIDILLSISPLDSNAIEHGVTITITDITRLKATERALEKRIVALTQPLKNTEISFDELFDIKEIQKTQDLFAEATGVSSVITKPDGTEITRPSNLCTFCRDVMNSSTSSKNNCLKQRMKLANNTNVNAIQKVARCGLLIASAKITIGQKHIANWYIGYVREEKVDQEAIKQLAKEQKLNPDTLLSEYMDIPVMSQQQFSIVVESLFAFADQLSNTAYQNIQQANLLSESKKAEEIVKNYNIKLQNEVKSRTDELEKKNNMLQKEIEERIKTEKELKAAQFQLIQSEKMASIGQLSSNIAHEINTPLGAIGSSNTTILHYFDKFIKSLNQYSSLVTDNEKYINDIINGIKKSPQTGLSTKDKRILIKELTDKLSEEVTCDPYNLACLFIDSDLVEKCDEYIDLFNKPDSEKTLAIIEMINSIYQGNTIIEQAIQQSSKIVFAMREYARANESDKESLTKINKSIDTALTINNNKIKHGIELNLEIDDVPEIMCNSSELSQVWTNLIHNSIQAMEGKGKLDISVKQDQNHIIVKITDNGCGIFPENMDKIFKPLFTTKPSGMGSGLGLDIVKRIIDRHKGSISVESKVGQGATFTVKLPIG